VQRAKVIVTDAGVKHLTECESCSEEKYILEGDSVCDECKSGGGNGGLFSRSCVYLEGLLARSVLPGTSGNIRLNASPLAVSGSSCGESFGWISSLLAEGSGPGGFTSLGIIATPQTYAGETKSPVQYRASRRTL
jgi:hypothetical protein